MINYGTLLAAIVPIFLVIAAGALARVLGFLPLEAEQPFNRLNLRLLYPCLVFNYTLGNAALMSTRSLVGAPALGFGITLGAMLLALVVARALRLPPASQRTFAFVTGITNYGYLPIPLSALLFDDATTGTLLVFGVGVEVAIWTFGILLLAGELRAEQFRKLLNPPVICLAAAIALNLSGASRYLPFALKETFRLLGNTAIPFGLLLIGAVLYDLTRKIDWLEHPRAPLASLILRLGVLPVAILLLTAFVPESMRETRRVLILQAAMPCGIFPIVITKYYHGDTALALRIVLLSTLAGVFLIPLWLTFGLRLFGLD
jgi:malate permease and related proteins